MPTNPSKPSSSSAKSGGGNKAKEIMNKITDPIKSGAKKFAEGTKKFGERVASFSKDSWSKVSTSFSDTMSKTFRRGGEDRLMIETKGQKPEKVAKEKTPKPVKEKAAAAPKATRAVPEYLKPIPTEKWMKQLEDIRSFLRSRAFKYDFDSTLAVCIDSGYAALHTDVTDKQELVKQWLSTEGANNRDIEFIGKKAWLASAKKNGLMCTRKIQMLMDNEAEFLRGSAFWSPELVSRVWLATMDYKRERGAQEERRQQEQLFEESRHQNEQLREELAEQRKMFDLLLTKLDHLETGNAKTAGTEAAPKAAAPKAATPKAATADKK